MEHAFGRAAPFALGVEEELLLVDPVSLCLSHDASELFEQLGEQEGDVKHDVYEALVETASPVTRSAEEAVAALTGLREALDAAGATLLGAGLHPEGSYGDVVHVPHPRYRAIAESMRGLLTRTPTCALHVHVGMPDPETAIAVCNGLRGFLPVLQGLAAHSPYWFGLDSGFATARAQLFRGFPRAVIPRAFASWDDYAATIADWVAAADVPDYTFMWWDVRPHPNLGTIEVRAMDAQARLASAAGLAALVHGLAAACADGHAPEAVPGDGLTETSFRAGRDGLGATIWWDDRLQPLRHVAAQALELARGHLRDLGGDAPLEEVERILREGNGADRMRAAHAQGGMRAVLERLVAETAEPARG